MPSVFFSTLAVVERNFQLMWGMPRTSTKPMIPATSTITSTALAQTSTVITRFHARREGEKPLFIAVSSLQYHVQHNVDEHDEHEQHQRDAE